MPRKKPVNPPATLETRPDDLVVTDENKALFLGLSLFKGLKKTPNPDKFPGTLALRLFRQGDVICQQGDAGWTAFYLLTADDVRGLPPECRERLREPAPPGDGAVASVHLAVGAPRRARPRGFLDRFFGRLLGRPAEAGGPRPRDIAIDAPAPVSASTGEAKLREGDLFGEMSCIYYRPRSATVVARRDCFVLEMLRNVLDQVLGDPKFEEKTDKVYKERVLETHLRGLGVFRDMTDEEFRKVRDRVELLRFKDGAVICDENDRSDSMYVIRNGVVKVVKGATALLAVEDVADWPGLVAALRGAEAPPPAQRHVAGLLPAGVRETAGKEAAALSDADRAEIVQALNEVIKGAPLTEETDLSDRDRRRCNRLLLEAAFPGLLRPLRRQAGPETVVAYRSTGEFIGEMGLMRSRPRSATCLAYVHPRPAGAAPDPVGDRWRRDARPVELVRIKAEDFRDLLASSPAIRAKVEEEVARREKADETLRQVPVWDEGLPMHQRGRFEELGLIQGQKLMLIDLDRCTRCDECVQACAATHADGRARLFLDGPRFGQYLVPTTCRSCLDPVCMIGCPVASIHRGDNREIVIEDWCIGCELCAKSCPYGSIQMHDLGVIPNGAHGWRYFPASALAGDGWAAPNYPTRRWLPGRTPFYDDLDFRAALLGAGPGAPGADPAVCFRYEFALDEEVLRRAAKFKMMLTSTDSAAVVWLNGQRVAAEKWKPDREDRVFLIEGDDKALLRAGRNVVAVRLTPSGASGKPLLEMSLDEVRASEAVIIHRAVVCDLCSSSPDQSPACVDACPHDAAMRVNARTEFPVR